MKLLTLSTALLFAVGIMVTAQDQIPAAPDAALAPDVVIAPQTPPEGSTHAEGSKSADASASIPEGSGGCIGSSCQRSRCIGLACGQSAEAPSDAESASTSMGLLLFVFVLAIFLGFELIAKVPSQLHTPLMSGSNAISGITIVGAILSSGRGSTTATVILGTAAVAFAMINVIGGYMVTDRMLGMFTHKGGDAK